MRLVQVGLEVTLHYLSRSLRGSTILNPWRSYGATRSTISSNRFSGLSYFSACSLLS
jgi:hypothetical protein